MNKKRKLLITGGSGFLGRNLANKLKDEYDVIIASRNNKNNLIASKLTGCRFINLDVSNIESVRDLLITERPEIIIHGAATKFVDLCEDYPMESVDINIVGSQNIARVAIETGVDIVIGISTDKATPPVRNMYGLTKATMEKLFVLMNKKSDTKFTCVRYGNVAWSTGSVLPIWKEQHETTGVIKSSGWKMRRFFFTIDEAVNLVVNAINNIDICQGNVLSRDMKSALMGDILNVWIKNHGGSWEKTKERLGERTDEFLVGDLELEYSKELMIDGIMHYIVSPNEKSDTPMKRNINSENCEKLNEEEILTLINAHPDIL